MAELDLRWTDLGERRNGNSATEAVTTYPYVDRAGTLIYEVVRLPGKQFRQRQPSTDGGWNWNLRGVTRTLYRLPAVIDAVAKGETVWVVEGEKDADRLAAAGVCATCNSGGAGKWHTVADIAAEVLHGATVRIVADRDDPGRAHAAEVATHLADVAASVEVVEAADGKDASDHLNAGRRLDEFRAVGEAATAEHPLAPYLIDWADFWSIEDHQEWLLEPLIAAGRAHAIYAGAKTGKSYLLLAACAALATGRPFLSHPGGDPVDVLYVDMEMTAEDIRDRLEEFGYGPGDNLSHLHYALLPSLPPLDTAEGGQALTASAIAVGARLVVIDTTARSVEGDENSSDTMRAFARCTGVPLKQAGIAVVRLDHAGKDATKGQRGTSAKNDDVDIVLRVERTDDGVRLIATHRRMSWFPESTAVAIAEEDGVVRFDTEATAWPAGTAELVAHLDRLGVPTDAGRSVARKALAGDGWKGRNAVVAAAVKLRKQRGSDPENLSPETRDRCSVSPRGQASGQVPETLGSTGGTGAGTGRDRGSDANGPVPPPIRGDRSSVHPVDGIDHIEDEWQF
jgi:5S rRNA maturation endonuclease (ribonuclease M5)